MTLSALIVSLGMAWPIQYPVADVPVAYDARGVCVTSSACTTWNPNTIHWYETSSPYPPGPGLALHEAGHIFDHTQLRGHRGWFRRHYESDGKSYAWWDGIPQWGIYPDAERFAMDFAYCAGADPNVFHGYGATGKHPRVCEHIEKVSIR